jgi:hypothetical protein
MKTIKITLIALATVLTSCTSLFEPKKATSETKTELITKSLNIEVKANEVNVVNLNFENTTASFRVTYTKNGNDNNGNFKINITNNLVNNQNTPIIFSGNNEFLNRYVPDQDISEKAFAQTGTVILNGKNDPNYNVTFVNSFPLNESSYAIFKVTNTATKKDIYGWLNFTVTLSEITFHKYGYSNEKLEYITDENNL